MQKAQQLAAEGGWPGRGGREKLINKNHFRYSSWQPKDLHLLAAYYFFCKDQHMAYGFSHIFCGAMCVWLGPIDSTIPPGQGMTLIVRGECVCGRWVMAPEYDEAILDTSARERERAVRMRCECVSCSKVAGVANSLALYRRRGRSA